MSGNASEPGYVGDALGRHLFPLRYGAPLNAKLGSEAGHQAALGAQQVHTDGHQDTLSLTVRQGKPETAAKKPMTPAHLLRTPKQASVHALRMPIAAKIRAARMAAGLSQRGLAKKMGVAGGAVAQWETGATMPTIARRAELAKLLNIQFLELLPEAEGKPSDGVMERQLATVVRIMTELPEHNREAFVVTLAGFAEALRGSDPDSRSVRTVKKKRA
jgi:transcriptional regulator with XRE-family HTH domain